MKRCLFCEQTIPVLSTTDGYRFMGCFCAPDRFYVVPADDYDRFAELPHPIKRGKFPLVSAHIRHLIEFDDKEVRLHIDELDAITGSPDLPASIEEKEALLLRYLHLKANGPSVPVVLRPLSSHYNLTYSPNLQEFVYVIERLREKGWIERIGTSFALTPAGWGEAGMLARGRGRRPKPCLVAAPIDAAVRAMWADRIFPGLVELGYMPRFVDDGTPDSTPADLRQLMADCSLVIADITGQDQAVYFAAGTAHGSGVPVLWTVRSGDDEEEEALAVCIDRTRLGVWESPESLQQWLTTALSV